MGMCYVSQRHNQRSETGYCINTCLQIPRDCVLHLYMWLSKFLQPQALKDRVFALGFEIVNQTNHLCSQRCVNLRYCMGSFLFSLILFHLCFLSISINVFNKR